ncbi:cadherin-related family member 4 [Ambystoma mexicanum]|uniref:cadherin-related family member 4 n=1 Tax=Ambystoma mexicanum TaxID=8296 RepID=UPI0037E83B13
MEAHLNSLHKVYEEDKCQGMPTVYVDGCSYHVHNNRERELVDGIGNAWVNDAPEPSARYKIGPQTQFSGLPVSVNIQENSLPGTVVSAFSIENCTDPNPQVSITAVAPTCTFFNTPQLTVVLTLNTYSVKITLSSTTALDFETVNQYQLTIVANCAGAIIQGQLFVVLTDMPEAPQCGAKFASPVGETVSVLENVSPSTPIYNVVTQGPVQGPLKVYFRLSRPRTVTRLHSLPLVILNLADEEKASFESYFQESSRSLRMTSVMTIPPSQGPPPPQFPRGGPGHGSRHNDAEDYEEQEDEVEELPNSSTHRHSWNFKLWITVTDANGLNCSGTLTVIVLPVYNNVIKFTNPNLAVTIKENGGPLFPVTTVTASGNDVLYVMVTQTAFFSIAKATGVISTTSNLDLEHNPGLATTVLTIKAYDQYNHSNSATITVTVTVQDVNELPPSCSPAVIVKDIPETTPMGTILAEFTCSDPDFSKTTLTYEIVPNSSSQYNFMLSGTSLQVNSTLTYDSALIASLNFQYSATLVVTDGGVPTQTTSIPIFVTVTPVNQYPPVCGAVSSFNVNENAPANTVIGSVNATDKDYKFNNVQYTISGGDANNPPVFFISPRSGEIHLLGSLDRETRQSYNLMVQVVDLNNDILPDPAKQKTTTCPITINVQDINDNPPICNPPYYYRTIYSTLSMTTPIVTLACEDVDINSVLSYSIVGGNINNRFQLAGDSILHNAFSYNPNGVYDPLTFELLIKVTDSPAPQFSTTATVIIHVVPWTTTVPTTTLKTTTSRMDSLRPRNQSEESCIVCWRYPRSSYMTNQVREKQQLRGTVLGSKNKVATKKSIQPAAEKVEQLLQKEKQMQLLSCKNTIKRTPLIVTGTQTYWAPDPWFVAVLTITAALLLLGLALLAWQIFKRYYNATYAF